MPRRKRIGRVEFVVGYTVDLDNEDMVTDAEDAITEDICDINRRGEIGSYIVRREDKNLKYNDIPDFLKENLRDK